MIQEIALDLDACVQEVLQEEFRLQSQSSLNQDSPLLISTMQDTSTLIADDKGKWSCNI